jgi:hypothetical protein
MSDGAGRDTTFTLTGDDMVEATLGEIISFVRLRSSGVEDLERLGGFSGGE